jgi:ATP-dependent DNA helicase RecG
MNASNLHFLFGPLTTVKGIGDALATRLKTTIGPRVLDLYFHLPFRFEQRVWLERLADYQPDTMVTLSIKVLGHEKPPRPKLPYKVLCETNGGFVYLLFFNMPSKYILEQLPVGGQRIVSGKLEQSLAVWQMIHPDYIGYATYKEDWVGKRPIYSMAQGISSKVFHRVIQPALSRIPDTPEWLAPETLEHHGWKSWQASLQQAHRPVEEEDLSPLHGARLRLAYDELLAEQISYALIRRHYQKTSGVVIQKTGVLTGQMKLPFSLTPGQDQAIAEILKDMESGTQMLRLLQGDVGSGKTMVAVYALLAALEAGYQGVLLAPTEILAQQLYRNLQTYAPFVHSVLFTGGTANKDKKMHLEGLAQGSIQIAVGTHALLEEHVQFKNLGLIVVDEQHRFGVEQRLRLTRKGIFPHVLVMSATPIPRTLCLTAYGELQITNLRDKPAQRQPITTSTMPLKRVDEVIESLSRVLAKGEKVFWVCPLIDESEALQLGHVMERFGILNNHFGDKVGLLHGRMKAEEKEAIMQSFKSGPLQILVSTTVIEVGVDIPDATVMVIEHAERFGLAQLHQLRGRVGRGNKPSTCLLLYSYALTETGKARLSILKESNDGFKIAEADLHIRGAGDLLGTRQSGIPLYRLADIFVHEAYIPKAQAEAEALIIADPLLSSPRGQAVRLLLKMFNKEQSMQYISAG